MQNLLSRIFITRHSELRVGWRLLVFFIAVSLGTLVWATLLHLAGLDAGHAELSAVLIASGTATFGLVRFLNRKPFRAVGLDLRWGSAREFGLGCFLGFLLMAGIFVVELMLGYVSVVPRTLTILEGARILVQGLFAFGAGALAEELLFRGYAFQTLMQGITFLPAMICFSVLFAAAHLNNPHISAFALINVALAGIWLSFAYLKTRTLWLPLGLHFSWNYSQTVLFALPTSGGEASGRSILTLVQSGPGWVTGSEFGPEGGLLATLALLIGTFYILKSPLYRRREGIVTLDSIEDIVPASAGRGEES
jgi:hypothetical protein